VGKVEESLTLMRELMAVIAMNTKSSAPADGSSDEKDCKRMSVSYLHRKLDERGRDVDDPERRLSVALRKERVTMVPAKCIRPG
jgi:hypothetical protein